MPGQDATSALDPRVRRIAQLLHDPAARLRERRIAVDGDELVAAALLAGLEVELVLEDARRAGDPAPWRELLPDGLEPIPAGDEVLRALGDLGGAPRVVAVCSPPPAPPDELLPHSLVLVKVRDEDDVGSIIRTAAALGLPRVLLTPGSGDPWSRTALRAAVGASFAPGMVAAGRSLASLAALSARPPLAAAVPGGGVPPSELPAGAAVALGSEEEGLSDDDRRRCDLAVTIPAHGFESLNVAAAAAILGWELSRS